MGTPRRTGFWRGFLAIAPLWLGVVPFGIVYAVIARDAGLSVVETQALSLFVFAGGAQFSAAGLFATGASVVGIVLTTFLLNVRHVLYGVSLGRRIPLPGWRRPAAAYFLTDEVFGVVAAQPSPTFPYLLGAELSLFLVWNVATLGGALLGAAIPDPAELGLAFVGTRVELVVAVASGTLAYAVAQLTASGGVPIVVTGVAGSLVGAWLTRGQAVEEPRLEDAIREVA